MRNPSLPLLLLSAAMLTPPAHAQPEVGSLDDTAETGTAMRREAQSVEDRAQINLYSKAVASCLMNRSGSRVRKLLRNSDPKEIDFTAAEVNRGQFMRLFEECMGTRSHEFSSNILLTQIGMSFTETRLRALLLEEAYLEDNEKPPVVVESESERADRPFVSEGDALVLAQGLGAFADCIAYRDTSNADALLRTEPGSGEEIKAAQNLAPTLGECLAAGQELQLTVSSIRAMVADGLWTRATFGPAAAE